MNQNVEVNPYDILGLPEPEEAKRYQEEIRAKGEHLDNLIHRVFTSEAGQEYLEIMTKSLIMSPTAQAGMDQLEIGIQEGVKQFIRNIILTIQKVESGEENE